jgi:hypothetical protein
MWLLLATVVEIPPAVSLAYSLTRSLFLIVHVTQVFIILNLNGTVTFFLVRQWRAED